MSPKFISSHLSIVIFFSLNLFSLQKDDCIPVFTVTWFCWWYRTPITVFVKGRNSNKLEKIARYGSQYEQDGETPLNVLFYYYGHYDLVELMID